MDRRGAGRDALRRWLVTPVDHLRDVRSAFLLKLVLLERLGLERGDLVAAQRVAFADLFARRAAAPSTDSVATLWRHHSAAAAASFLDALEKPPRRTR